MALDSRKAEACSYYGADLFLSTLSTGASEAELLLKIF